MSEKNDRFYSLLQELLQKGYLKAIAPTFLKKLLDRSSDWTTEAIGQAYEQFLHQSDHVGQKAGGVFYTPAIAVNDIVQNTVLQRLADSSETLPTVLDPACGGGAFLLAAYQALLDWQLQQHLKNIAIAPHDNPNLYKTSDGVWKLCWNERSRILTHCIYGVDIDLQAVDVTRLALWLQLLQGEELGDRSLPNLDHNIQCGNALIGTDFAAQFPKAQQIRTLDWQMAFPEVLKDGGFDIVLGNPPYIDSEWMTATFPEWRSYCTRRYRSASGNWDIFCVFIEKALEVCRTGGLVSFIVPNKLASADYAVQARSLLTQENQLLAIHDYTHVSLFSVAVYPLIFVVRKGMPDSRTTVRYQRVAKENISLQFIAYDRFTQGSKPWCLSDRPLVTDLLTRLQTLPTLADQATVTGAATVAEAYELQCLIQDKITPETGDLLLVNSGTLDRYQFLWGKKPLRYLGATYSCPVIPRILTTQLPARRYQQAIHPKIIVAGMTKGLECAVDLEGTFLAGKSTVVIQSAIALPYLLGILNSRLITLFFTNLFSGNQLQGGYLRVGAPQLRQLPLPLLNEKDMGDRHRFHQLISLVEKLTGSVNDPQQSSPVSAIDKQIDHLVYELYRLSDREIQTLELEFSPN